MKKIKMIGKNFLKFFIMGGLVLSLNACDLDLWSILEGDDENDSKTTIYQTEKSNEEKDIVEENLEEDDDADLEDVVDDDEDVDEVEEDDGDSDGDNDVDEVEEDDSDDEVDEIEEDDGDDEVEEIEEKDEEDVEEQVEDVEIVIEDVSDLEVIAGNGTAILSWINPENENYFGSRVSVSPEITVTVTTDKGETYQTKNSSVIIQGQSGDASAAVISGLTNGMEYTFLVQSLGKGNSSSSTENAGVSIKASPVDTSDNIPPGEVSDLKISAENAVDGKVNALLSWKDPKDEDLLGIEVSYFENDDDVSAGARASLPLEAIDKNTIFVAAKKKGICIPGLTSGKSYIFTLKTMDTNCNKSSGVTTEATLNLNQLKELKLSLSASTKEITNQDVTVTVKASSSSPVNKIFYSPEFITKIDTVLSKGIDITETKSFVASENGTYSVVATDFDGRREIAFLTLKNIDKTPPSAPTNLVAKYSYAERKIFLTWDCQDKDVDYYLVGYTWETDTDSPAVEVTEKSYCLENVEPVGQTSNSAFIFTVIPVDKVGNIGSASSTSIKPLVLPFIEGISLNKNHLAYNASNKNIEVTIKGGNFDTISLQEDDSLKVQVESSDGQIISVSEANLDFENNSATAIITIPELEKSTVSGKKYTVRPILCGQEDSEHFATFNVSSPASVSRLTLDITSISESEVTEELTTKVTVKGSNFDIAGKICIAIYDESKILENSGENAQETEEESSEIKIFEVDSTEFTQATKTFDFDLQVPATEGIYTVAVLFDDQPQEKTAELQVYGKPRFTSFSIPEVCTSKFGQELKAFVLGRNFTVSGVTLEDFSLSSSSGQSVIENSSPISIKDDGLISISLTIPNVAGIYEITLATKENNTIKGNFVVKSPSDYEVGEIILASGSKVKISDFESYEIDSTNPPIAVVAGFNGYGIPFAIGLRKTSASWAKKGTLGYEKLIEETISEYTGSIEDGYIFTGDLDGSDNFQFLSFLDPVGTADSSLAEYYTTYDFVQNYASGQGLSGNFATGWYLPSISELYEISQNYDVVKKSMTKAGGFDLGNCIFWSSSQDSENNEKNHKIKLSSQEIGINSKTIRSSVLAAHKL